MLSAKKITCKGTLLYAYSHREGGRRGRLNQSRLDRATVYKAGLKIPT
jgi:hypothetical protein